MKRPLRIDKDTEGRCRRLAWSPDSRLLASYSADGAMHVRDALEGTLRFTYGGLAAGAGIFAWCPEVKRIACLKDDGRICILSAE